MIQPFAEAGGFLFSGLGDLSRCVVYRAGTLAAVAVLDFGTERLNVFRGFAVTFPNRRQCLGSKAED